MLHVRRILDECMIYSGQLKSCNIVLSLLEYVKLVMIYVSICYKILTIIYIRHMIFILIIQIVHCTNKSYPWEF